VVYYAGYLRYFEAARTEFMRERVAAYREIEKAGLIMPVVECHARYKAPARYDDLLLVETSLCNVRDFSCRFDYRVIREEGARTLVLGYTVHTAVDARGKLQRFPAELLALLRRNSRESL
jgi:acyl-CoA thioester hydrolase